jgi:predicted DNA-binding protein with PD1-like motif
MNPLKLYVPAGNWLVQTLTEYCTESGLGNAQIAAIGSIANIWVLVNPDGKPLVKNWPAGSSHEMTSLSGNVALREGQARFDRQSLPSGAYPQFDTTDPALNPYLHLHVTFAEPDMTIAGGHLLDAEVSIGAEVVLVPMATDTCAPGLVGPPPCDCVTSVPVTVPPYGTFSNWDQRFWYPPTR